MFINAFCQIAPNYTPCTLNETNLNISHISRVQFQSTNDRTTVRLNNEGCSTAVCGENTTLCSNMHLYKQMQGSKQVMAPGKIRVSC